MIKLVTISVPPTPAPTKSRCPHRHWTSTSLMVLTASIWSVPSGSGWAQVVNPPNKLTFSTQSQDNLPHYPVRRSCPSRHPIGQQQQHPVANGHHFQRLHPLHRARTHPLSPPQTPSWHFRRNPIAPAGAAITLVLEILELPPRSPPLPPHLLRSRQSARP